MMVMVVVMVVLILGESRERREAKGGAKRQSEKLSHHGVFLQ